MHHLWKIKNNTTFTRYVTSWRALEAFALFCTNPLFTFGNLLPSSLWGCSAWQPLVTLLPHPPRAGHTFQCPRRNAQFTRRSRKSVLRESKAVQKNYPFFKNPSQLNDAGWKWVKCNWEFISKAMTQGLKMKPRHTLLQGNTVFTENFSSVEFTWPLPSHEKISVCHNEELCRGPLERMCHIPGMQCLVKSKSRCTVDWKGNYLNSVKQTLAVSVTLLLFWGVEGGFLGDSMRLTV